MYLAREMFRGKVKGNFDDIPDNLRASSKCLVGSHRANSSTHLEHEGTIFYGGNDHCYQDFKQDDNAKLFNVSNDNSEDTSECYLKHQKTRPNKSLDRV